MKVAIIPARGGSKRIPRKNIRPFMGKPIIAYSIATALESGLFDSVIVSTDDEEIAVVARRWGAEAPFLRPKELANDYTSTNAVVKHAIQWLEQGRAHVEYVCCIYATAPLLQIKYLREGYEKLIRSDKSCVFSVTSFPFPIQRAIRIDSKGQVVPLYPEHINKRSQDLEEVYHDAGQFYWSKAKALLNDSVNFSPTSLPVILPRYLVQDIDTPEDWRRAELMYQAWKLAEG